VTVARVLLADRSQAVRSVLRRLLDGVPGVAVVGDTADGAETLRLAVETAPDAIVLDLDLPTVGGRGLVEKIGSLTRARIFALTPRRDNEAARIAISLLNIGVVAIFPKPEVPDEWLDLGRTLGEAVSQLGATSSSTEPALFAADDTPVVGRDLRYVAVGASTGGPGAVFDLLASLGRRSRVGFAVVQHIAAGFEGAFAAWLAAELGLDVKVARHGELLRAGQVRIAPSACHLVLDPHGVLSLDADGEPVNGHRPSVDMLFQSLLGHPPGRIAAVLLSGMGTDGADGLCELRRANVLTIVQDEGSSAVFGMPRAALERRGASFALAPQQIGRLLARAGAVER
jgi:two-component system chemotaxis response regulator CheB